MIGATVAGKYRVLRELGRGGMGVVYLVEHVHTGDHLALKVLLHHAGASREVVERFRREARAPARIKSEGVVKITDFDVAPELGGAPFLVMELLNGRDVEKLLESQGRLHPQQVVKIMTDVAAVLDRAHAVGVVHRDLKPENMFIHRRHDGTDVLKLVDFGISRISGEGMGDMTSAALTKSGAMMGTPLYMSPEQARGVASKIGPPTDMWSLGLIAHRLLTGDVYWTADTLAELMVQIIAEPMSPPSRRWPWLPPAFDAWFARSCDRDPSRRFGSVTEQMAHLSSVLGFAAPMPAPEALSASTSGSHPSNPSNPSNPSVPLPALAQSTASVARTLGPRPSTTSSVGTSRRGWVVGGIAAVAVLAGSIGAAIHFSTRNVSAPTTSAAAHDETEPAPHKKTVDVDPPSSTTTTAAPTVDETAPSATPPPVDSSPLPAAASSSAAVKTAAAVPWKPKASADPATKTPKTSASAAAAASTGGAFDPAAP